MSDLATELRGVDLDGIPVVEIPAEASHELRLRALVEANAGQNPYRHESRDRRRLPLPSCLAYRRQGLCPLFSVAAGSGRTIWGSIRRNRQGHAIRLDDSRASSDPGLPASNKFTTGVNAMFSERELTELRLKSGRCRDGETTHITGERLPGCCAWPTPASVTSRR